MKSSTKNRVIGIILILAMSTGLIVSGLSMFMKPAQSQNTSNQTNQSTSADLKNETEESKESSPSIKEARAAVTGYFSSLKDGNVAKAYTYCEEEMPDLFALKEKQKEFDESIKNEPKEIQDIMKDYYSASAAQYVREYAIEDSVADHDDAAFLVHIQTADFSKLQPRDETRYNEAIQEYVSSHLEELNNMVNEKSQEEADNFLRAMKMKDYYADVKEDLKALPQTDLQIQVLSKKQADGTYKISLMESAE